MCLRDCRRSCVSVYKFVKCIYLGSLVPAYLNLICLIALTLNFLIEFLDLLWYSQPLSMDYFMLFRR